MSTSVILQAWQTPQRDLFILGFLDSSAWVVVGGEKWCKYNSTLAASSTEHFLFWQNWEGGGEQGGGHVQYWWNDVANLILTFCLSKFQF